MKNKFKILLYKSIYKNIKRGLFVTVLLLAVSCGDVIEYSPYDIEVVKEDLNTENISSIHSTEDDTVVFALISDTHSYYNDFTYAVKYINNIKDIDFAVICGDITDAGLATEFEWYYSIARKLKVPYFTIIGNHDYRSNGGTIFRKMFGETNFCFNYGKYRFIGFDNVVWENNNATPDFEWLKQNVQLENIEEQRASILFSHIPHTSDQLAGEKAAIMKSIIQESPIQMVIYGHDHTYRYEKENDIEFVSLESMNEREVVIIHLTDNATVINRQSF